MRTLIVLTVFSALAAPAAAQTPPPEAIVPITSFRDVAGTWVGKEYNSIYRTNLRVTLTIEANGRATRFEDQVDGHEGGYAKYRIVAASLDNGGLLVTTDFLEESDNAAVRVPSGISRFNPCVNQTLYLWLTAEGLKGTNVALGFCTGGNEISLVRQGTQQTSVTKPQTDDVRGRLKCIMLNRGDCAFTIAAAPLRPYDWWYSAALWQSSMLSQVWWYSDLIDRVAREKGVDAKLIKSIMYSETTRGYYDYLYSWADLNDTVLPMNVSVATWGDVFGGRAALEDAYTNISAGAELVKRIQANLPKDAPISHIATLYNNLAATEVNSYGELVQANYAREPWLYWPWQLL